MRLVFIDETWAKTNMAPLRGWGPRGARLRAAVPHGHWKTMTFLAGLRSNGYRGAVGHRRTDQRRQLSRLCRAGPRAHPLAPTLSRGDIVVMDNLGSHKSPAIRAALRAAGAKLFYLPPYSPDLNPIEQVFAKLKHLLRKAAERTVQATWRRIGDLLDRFKPEECARYFANAGNGSR